MLRDSEKKEFGRSEGNMNKKTKSIGIVAVVICAFSIGAIFYFNNNTINYGILLIDSDGPGGGNITLAYDIKNGMLAPSVSDVYLDIWVFHLNDTQHGLLHYYIPIYGLNREEQKDRVNIASSLLDPGEYIIHTNLFYKTADVAYYKQPQLEMKFTIV